MTDIEFVGDAHAAMQLHRLLADQARRLQDVGLGGGDAAAAFGGVIRVGTHGGQRGHGAGLLGGDHHVGHAVLQGLELADRRAELLARLEVFERDFVERGHDADGFGAERGVGVIDGALDQRQGAAGGADQGLGCDLHAVEAEVRGARAVLGRVASQAEAGRPGVDQEQREAEAFARRNDELACRWRGEHHRLGAVELPAAAGRRGFGGDVVEGVAAAGFKVGEGEHQFAAGDGGQQGLLLRGAAGITNQASAEHDAGQVGFERQAATEHFHHQHAVDGVAIETAEVLGEGQGEDAEFGEGGPGGAIEAVRRLGHGAAVFEAVVAGIEAAQGVLQGDLFFRVVEVHGVRVRGSFAK